MADPITDEAVPEKKDEWHTFIFLTVFLAPIIAIVVAGGYGFLVWISQILTGPPSI